MEVDNKVIKIARQSAEDNSLSFGLVVRRANLLGRLVEQSSLGTAPEVPPAEQTNTD